MSGLYRDEVGDLLDRGVLRHTASAALGDGTPLRVLRGRVDFDEDRAPRVQATLDIPLDSLSTYEALDPRTPSDVAVFAGYRHPSGWASDGLLLDGIVTERGAVRPGNIVTIQVESTERVVLDAAASKPGTSVSLGSRAGAARRIVNLAFPVDPPWIDTTSDGTSATDPDLPNRDKWDVIQDFVDQIGCDIYDRGDRTWVIEYRKTAASTPVHTLHTGAGATVTSSNVRTVRGEGYANRVQLVYQWTTTGGSTSKVVAIRDITAGPFTVAAGNIVTHREVRDVPTTQTLANSAAAELVKRLASRGSFYEVAGPSAYWLRPGDTVTLDLPAGGDSNFLVSRVGYDLGTGVMTLALRTPDLSMTVGAPV